MGIYSMMSLLVFFFTVIVIIPGMLFFPLGITNNYSMTKLSLNGSGIGCFTLDDSSHSWQCLYDMVLVQRIKGRTQTDGGIYLPEGDTPKMHLCRVISVGPGRKGENGIIEPMPKVKSGDIIIAKNP